MLSVAQAIKTIYEVQKSKFFCFLFPVTTLAMVEEHLSEIKKQYPDATHHCYAYIIDNYKRCSDDGEPSGTAGTPILNVLEKQNLNFILCIVVRYFGGVLLGAGGLVRAYTNSVTTALKEASFADMVLGQEIDIVFSYEDKKHVDLLLKDTAILSSNYQEVISYQIIAPNIIWNEIKEQLFPYLLDYRVKKTCYCILKKN